MVNLLTLELVSVTTSLFQIKLNYALKVILCCDDVICIQRAIFVILNIWDRKQWLCIPDQTRVFNVVCMGSVRLDDVTPVLLCHYRPPQSSYELLSLLINSRKTHIVRQVCVCVCLFMAGSSPTPVPKFPSYPLVNVCCYLRWRGGFSATLEPLPLLHQSIFCVYLYVHLLKAGPCLNVAAPFLAFGRV